MKYGHRVYKGQRKLQKRRRRTKYVYNAGTVAVNEVVEVDVKNGGEIRY